VQAALCKICTVGLIEGDMPTEAIYRQHNPLEYADHLPIVIAKAQI